MANLPVQFRKAGEQVIASYDSTDIAEGTGLVEFDGFTTKQDTTTTYLLSSATVRTNDVETSTAAVTTANAKRLDLDFDLSAFNLPKNIVGTAMVTATLKGVKNATVMNYYYIARIKKNDVEIASAQSETNGSNASTDYYTMTVQIPITTIQNFKKGDVLRLTMEVWAGTTAGSGTVTLYHDPHDTTVATALTTQLKCHIPFRIDL